MRIELSGGIRVNTGDGPIDLGPAKSQAVFAALALSPGRAVTVERIVELVWGADPPRTAEKTLQNYVGSLRRSLGAGAIDRVGGAYLLVVDPGSVDLVRFEQLLDAGDDAAAIQLWQGPPLAGLKADGFDAVIGRLVERYMTAIEASMTSRVESGQGADEIGGLRELTGSHPLREGLWALLMRALYQTGRQAEALRAFDEARSHLVEGLGIEPGPALTALHRQILDQDAALEVTDASREANQSASQLNDQPHQAFLFTDIADSTSLWDRHGDEMRLAVGRHDQALSHAVVAYGGEIFKRTGDGVLAVFDSSAAATNAAVAAQLDLDQIMIGSDPLSVRMTISSGWAEARDDDWFGPPLNIAARLLDAAHGSQVLLSGAAFERLDNNVEEGITSTALGLLRLRGLSRPEQVHQVLHAALPRRFPPLRTRVDERASADFDFPPQLAYEGSTPFVGRSDLRTSIGELWSRVRSGEGPGIVLLGGEPGAGKTRLAATVAKSIHEETGATVLYGRCIEGFAVPFRPFAEALGAYATARTDSELRTEMGPDATYLGTVIQHLADRFPDLAQPLDASEASRLRVHGAVSSFLQAASSSPLVLVLDDIHWSDQASLDLLRHLSQHLLKGRLLIIATYRDVEVERSHPLAGLLADLRREQRVERHRVGGINGDDAVAFTEAVFGHELSEPGREVAARIAADSNGNPFFLQEMLRHFMESGVLVRRDGRWTTDSPDTIEISVPEGIREVVGRRLDQVSQDCNALLRTASAMAADFDIDLLIDVDGLDEERALDLLDEALEAGLLVEGERAGRYEFSHALIRQTLYSEFNTARRLRLHRRIAETLESKNGNSRLASGTIAHHYLAASTSADPGKIAHWGLAAADEMTERFAFGEASDLLERVSDEVLDDLPAQRQIQVHAALAASLMVQLRLEESEAALAACVRLAPLVAPQVLGGVALSLAQAETSRSFGGTAHGLLVELLATTDLDSMDEEFGARLYVQRVRNEVDPMKAERLVEQLESMDDLSKVAAFDVILTAAILDRDLAETLLGHASELDDSTRHPLAKGKTKDLLHTLEQMLWHMDEARQILASVPISVQTLDTGGRSTMRTAVSHMFDAFVRGDISLSETIRETVREWLLGTQLEIAMDLFPRTFGYELDEALGPPNDELWEIHPYGVFRKLMPFLPPIRRRVPDESDLLELARAPLSSASAAEIAALVWEIGSIETARVLKPRLEPASGLAVDSLSNSLTTIFAVDYFLGLLAETLGDLDEAIDLHYRGLDQHRSAGYILDVGYSSWQLYRVLTKRGGPGDADTAQTIIGEAIELLEPTPFGRIKRLINEELAEEPS